MSHKYGPFPHLEPNNFHVKFKHRQWLEKLEDETCRSSDEFIRHYKSKYQGFPVVPIWILVEVMSLGSLSLLYQGLQNNQKLGIEDKRAISSRFNLHHKQLLDWLHTLTYIRNLCAHHGRLWNRELSIRADFRGPKEWLPPVTPRNDRVFYILIMLRHFLRSIVLDQGNDWAFSVTNLLRVIAVNPKYRIAMGVPEDWEVHPIWR